MFEKCELTSTQKRMMEVARVGLMTHAPFFAHYFYDVLVEHPTKSWPDGCLGRIATDGRRIYYDPDYLETLKIPEIYFALCHEIHHAVMRHPARMKHYKSQGTMRNLPWDQDLFNVAADLIINAGLVLNKTGLCNSSWLYDPRIDPNMLVEDLYEQMYNKKPPPVDQRSTVPRPVGPGGRGGKVGQLPVPGDQTGNAPTYGEVRRLGKPDTTAAANGGSFDQLMEPRTDPVTGSVDVPSEGEHKESVARAAAAARALDNMPGNLKKMVEEILEPVVSWRDHLRMLVTSRIGSRREDWSRPNRRRVALGRGDPTKTVLMPGRRGSGAGLVAVIIDSSGSIYADKKTLAVFMAELGAIVQDCRPKRVIVIHCDAQIQRVDEASSLAEVEDVRVRGTVGGGGTDFRPPYLELEKRGIVPDTLVYLTDGYGVAPKEAPSYPVIWAVTKGGKEQAWGEHVWIETT